MGSSQHHTLPGHSQPVDRTTNPISQMRGVMHREVDYFTVKSPIQIPTTLVPQPFPNPFEQLRPFTMWSHTTTCDDREGGRPLLPLLLFCVLATERVIFVPGSEAVSCIPLCGLSSAISTFCHI